MAIQIREFDASRYLADDETILEYLDACLNDPNPDVFLGALGDVAKARGIAALAHDTGLSRESIYKTFAPGTKPRFETIQKIAGALGMSMTIKRSSREKEMTVSS